MDLEEYVGDVVSLYKYTERNGNIYLGFNLNRKLADFMDLGRGDMVEIVVKNLEGETKSFNKELGKATTQGQYKIYVGSKVQDELGLELGETVAVFYRKV